MPTIFEKLTARFLKHKKLSLQQITDIIKADKNCTENTDTILEILKINGFPISQHQDDSKYIELKTQTKNIKDEIFCFVDIETNGSKPNNAQIIEVAGIKMQNEKIIDSYQSLIFNDSIPYNVQEITNITPKLLENAPSKAEVLKEFKLFLQDSIFVAHGVSFDYNFISHYLEKLDLGKLENRKICTLKFAQKTMQTQKYSLRFFNEYLNINIENLHRAYNDSYISMILFNECLKNEKVTATTTEELISFVH